MSTSLAPAGSPLLSWSDVVFTVRESGDHRVLLGAADLEVYDGESVCITSDDPATRRALVELLTGRTRPRYGVISGAGRRIRGSSDPVVSILIERDQSRATVIVAPSSAPVPAVTRMLSVKSGGLRPVVHGRRWPAPLIRAAVVDRLTGAGAPAAAAGLVADVLVDADVRGHHSHGVELLPMYLERMRCGGIDPLATPSWITRSQVVHVLSGNGGFGQLAAREAALACAEAALAHGMAAVAVRNNNHIGMLAAYREPYIRAGVIGLILNISGPSVAVPGARKAALGNNAVCLVAAGDGTPVPLIADFATGAVASGKIRDLATRGARVPDGWLLGPDGEPSTDPRDLDSGGSVPIFGGSASAYKGLCVAVITEVLAGMLAGATISPLVSKQRQHPERAMNCSQLFIGFSPAAFHAGDMSELTTKLTEAVANAYGPAGPPPVHFPEQLEQLRTRQAAEEGVPLAESLARELGLAW